MRPTVCATWLASIPSGSTASLSKKRYAALSVRAAWNRGVDHPEKYLWETVAAAPVLGETVLHVPRSGARQARSARLALRCVPVQLRPPRSRGAEDLPSLEVFAIHALEIEPPQGVEPLEWMLLSSMPTQTLEDALERLSWYARRWTIESWHRVLKSGCQIEARQFGTLERFLRATALFAVIGWRIMYATMLGRLEADIPCSALLQSLEWRALYCRTHGTTKPPEEAPKLSDAVLWIASSVATWVAKTTIPREPPSSGAASSPCTKSPKCIGSSRKTSKPPEVVGKAQAT